MFSELTLQNREQEISKHIHKSPFGVSSSVHPDNKTFNQVFASVIKTLLLSFLFVQAHLVKEAHFYRGQEFTGKLLLTF